MMISLSMLSLRSNLRRKVFKDSVNRMTSSRQGKEFDRLFTLDGCYYIDASLPERGYEWQLKIGLTKHLFNTVILGIYV
jgi:hypothetical protein